MKSLDPDLTQFTTMLMKLHKKTLEEQLLFGTSTIKVEWLEDEMIPKVDDEAALDAAIAKNNAK